MAGNPFDGDGYPCLSEFGFGRLDAVAGGPVVRATFWVIEEWLSGSVDRGLAVAEDDDVGGVVRFSCDYVKYEL